MAIQTVRAKINGSWHTLTLNTNTGAYEATIQAPSTTSYNQPNHYYNIQVEVTNTAGTQVTADGSTFDELQLHVKEKVAPVITITSPTDGARVTNNKQPIIFTATDEQNGSGIDLSSLVVKVNGTQVTSAEIETQTITNGYQFTYTPSGVLENGSNTVTVNISDNDENVAAEKSVTFTVDTVAPTLNITSPVDNYLTNNASLAVSGTTNDETSSPVTVGITLNGADQGAVTVESNGTFSKLVTLTEGDNVIVITATDQAGNSTSITRNVGLDTSVPEIVSATIMPNPVDAGETMVISVVIE